MSADTSAGAVSLDRSVDAITFAVVTSGLTDVCRHMAESLRRTAYSPIIHDGADFSCALVSGDYDVIAEEGCPIHLGTLPFSVRAAVTEYGEREPLVEGDILAMNDPYRGSVHLNDIAFISPVFVGGELVCYVTNRAHWPDIGGFELAGSAARELLHEGVVVPPVKVRRAGAMNDDLARLLLENVRGNHAPGDFSAQIASLETGLARVRLIFAKYGKETVMRCLGEAVDYSARRMRRAIENIPDGVYEASDVMDDDGVSLEPIPIHVRITVRGETMSLDYSGSGPQAAGAINSVWAMTLSSTYIIIKALLDPFGPSTSGWHNALEVYAPEGCFVNPRKPAPVFGGGIEAGPRIFDVVMRALKDAMPERVTGAPYGTMDTSFLSGIDPDTGEHFIFNDWIPGGWGGCRDHDGVNCLIILCANTDDIPIEITELKYPLRYRLSELIMDSGGPGRFRGGLGVAREIEVLSDGATASLQADRTRTAPWGVFGGGAGRRTRYLVKQADGSEAVVGGVAPDGSYQSAKKSLGLPRGAILRIESAGGGGYGDPMERDPERVEADVREGYVSKEMARVMYGSGS